MTLATDRMDSRSGHVVVRVAPGGGSYRGVVTDNRDEGDRVIALLGPFLVSPITGVREHRLRGGFDGGRRRDNMPL